MLLAVPASLEQELINRYTALQQAEENYALNPSVLNLLIRNAARNALNKTLDKCSVELSQPTLPRPEVVESDGVLMLQYAA